MGNGHRMPCEALICLVVDTKICILAATWICDAATILELSHLLEHTLGMPGGGWGVDHSLSDAARQSSGKDASCSRPTTTRIAGNLRWKQEPHRWQMGEAVTKRQDADEINKGDNCPTTNLTDWSCPDAAINNLLKCAAQGTVPSNHLAWSALLAATQTALQKASAPVFVQTLRAFAELGQDPPAAWWSPVIARLQQQLTSLTMYDLVDSIVALGVLRPGAAVLQEASARNTSCSSDTLHLSLLSAHAAALAGWARHLTPRQASLGLWGYAQLGLPASDPSLPALLACVSDGLPHLDDAAAAAVAEALALFLCTVQPPGYNNQLLPSGQLPKQQAPAGIQESHPSPTEQCCLSLHLQAVMRKLLSRLREEGMLLAAGVVPAGDSSMAQRCAQSALSAALVRREAHTQQSLMAAPPRPVLPQPLHPSVLRLLVDTCASPNTATIAQAHASALIAAMPSMTAVDVASACVALRVLHVPLPSEFAASLAAALRRCMSSLRACGVVDVALLMARLNGGAAMRHHQDAAKQVAEVWATLLQALPQHVATLSEPQLLNFALHAALAAQGQQAAALLPPVTMGLLNASYTAMLCAMLLVSPQATPPAVLSLVLASRRRDKRVQCFVESRLAAALLAAKLPAATNHTVVAALREAWQAAASAASGFDPAHTLQHLHASGSSAAGSRANEPSMPDLTALLQVLDSSAGLRTFPGHIVMNALLARLQTHLPQMAPAQLARCTAALAACGGGFVPQGPAAGWLQRVLDVACSNLDDWQASDIATLVWALSVLDTSKWAGKERGHPPRHAAGCLRLRRRLAGRGDWQAPLVQLMQGSAAAGRCDTAWRASRQAAGGTRGCCVTPSSKASGGSAVMNQSGRVSNSANTRHTRGELFTPLDVRTTLRSLWVLAYYTLPLQPAALHTVFRSVQYWALHLGPSELVRCFAALARAQLRPSQPLLRRLWHRSRQRLAGLSPSQLASIAMSAMRVGVVLPQDLTEHALLDAPSTSPIVTSRLLWIAARSRSGLSPTSLQAACTRLASPGTLARLPVGAFAALLWALVHLHRGCPTATAAAARWGPATCGTGHVEGNSPCLVPPQLRLALASHLAALQPRHAAAADVLVLLWATAQLHLVVPHPVLQRLWDALGTVGVAGDIALLSPLDCALAVHLAAVLGQLQLTLRHLPLLAAVHAAEPGDLPPWLLVDFLWAASRLRLWRPPSTAAVAAPWHLQSAIQAAGDNGPASSPVASSHADIADAWPSGAAPATEATLPTAPSSTSAPPAGMPPSPDLLPGQGTWLRRGTAIAAIHAAELGSAPALRLLQVALHLRLPLGHRALAVLQDTLDRRLVAMSPQQISTAVRVMAGLGLRPGPARLGRLVAALDRCSDSLRPGPLARCLLGLAGIGCCEAPAFVLHLTGASRAPCSGTCLAASGGAACEGCGSTPNPWDTRLQAMTADQLTMTLSGLALLQPPPPAAWVNAWVAELRPRLASCSKHGLTRASAALARLRVWPGRPWLNCFGKRVRVLLKQGRLSAAEHAVVKEYVAQLKALEAASRPTEGVSAVRAALGEVQVPGTAPDGVHLAGVRQQDSRSHNLAPTHAHHMGEPTQMAQRPPAAGQEGPSSALLRSATLAQDPRHPMASNQHASLPGLRGWQRAYGTHPLVLLRLVNAAQFTGHACTFAARLVGLRAAAALQGEVVGDGVGRSRRRHQEGQRSTQEGRRGGTALRACGDDRLLGLALVPAGVPAMLLAVVRAQVLSLQFHRLLATMLHIVGVQHAQAAKQRGVSAEPQAQLCAAGAGAAGGMWPSSSGPTLPPENLGQLSWAGSCGGQGAADGSVLASCMRGQLTQALQLKFVHTLASAMHAATDMAL